MKKDLHASFDKTSFKISKLLIEISAVATIIWPIVVTAYIILRSMSFSLLFVEEFTEYWLVLVTFFSLAYTLREKKHIGVDILINYLPLKIRKVIGLITDFLSFLAVIYLFSKSLQWAIDGFLIKSRSYYPSNIILWPIYVFIPLGLIVFEFELLNAIIYKIKSLNK